MKKVFVFVIPLIFSFVNVAQGVEKPLKITQKEIECMKELEARLIVLNSGYPIKYEIEKLYLQLLYQRGYSFCEVLNILEKVGSGKN